MEVTKATLRAELANSLSEVLESMAFMEAEAAEIPYARPSSEHWTTLLVHDPVQGEFRMQMSRQMLVNIAEAIYGLLGEGMTTQVLDDTLAEMINTVAGHFLNKVLPGEQIYQLGLPELGKGLSPLAEESALVCDFSTEGEVLRVLASGKGLLNLGRAD